MDLVDFFLRIEPEASLRVGVNRIPNDNIKVLTWRTLRRFDPFSIYPGISCSPGKYRGIPNNFPEIMSVPAEHFGSSSPTVCQRSRINYRELL
jgi:hypothetical protein